jgi:hypothetical protein
VLFVYGSSPGNRTYETDGQQFFVIVKAISLKLATVLALTCPKRILSLAKLDINHHRLSPEGTIFTLTTPTKISRPDETVTAFFSSFTRCCFVSGGLICPSQNALGHRQRKNLIFSLSRILNFIVTVSRWLRSFLREAGVDTSVFKTHSVRGAATSAAAKAFVPLQEILNMAEDKLILFQYP